MKPEESELMGKLRSILFEMEGRKTRPPFTMSTDVLFDTILKRIHLYIDKCTRMEGKIKRLEREADALRQVDLIDYLRAKEKNHNGNQ